MDRLEPIAVESIASLQALVTQSIREAILNGIFRPGEKLIQEDLARQLGVSRQPVREALRRLESEGLVVSIPRRGLYVREYSDEDVREMYMLRRLLEAQATRLAAPRLEPGDWEELERITEGMDEAAERHDGDEFVALNNDFHHTIYDACGAPKLIQFITQLWSGYIVYTPVFLPGRAKRSVAEHAEIVAALRQRDGDGAAHKMEQHIAAAADDFFEFSTRGWSRD